MFSTKMNIDLTGASRAANGNVVELTEDQVAGVDGEYVVSHFNHHVRHEEVLIVPAPTFG